eukprot:51247_1
MSTRFISTKLIPLNGLRPIIYNFELNITSKLKDIKSKLLELMADHNRGIKYLVTWFLNQIQGILSVQNIQHSNTCNSLCIIPTDILNLCGKFYDQFYAVTIDIKYHNLDLNVVYPLDAPITRCSSTQFTAFQLL